MPSRGVSVVRRYAPDVEAQLAALLALLINRSDPNGNKKTRAAVVSGGAGCDGGTTHAPDQ
jgi:hypothetical protein